MSNKKSFIPKKEWLELCVVMLTLVSAFGIQHAIPDSPYTPNTETSSIHDMTADSVSGNPSMETSEPESSAVPSETKKNTPKPDEKIVYLTFDDGPSINTARILDVLDDHNVRATFFVIHSYEGCEQQIREIHNRGHCVALHAYNHRYSIYRSAEAYFDDLNKISDLVYNATGERSMLLRFPGGSSNTISKRYSKGIMTRLSRAVTEKGYVYFDWNCDSMDAAAVTNSVDVIKRYATNLIGRSNHIILLMHDAQAKTTTPQALPDIIAAYRDAGYHFDVLSADSFCFHHEINN